MTELILFSPPLEECVFEQRYKRFFCDVRRPQTNSVLTVHCANSGSMKSCLVPEAPALISDSMNPKRKLRHSLEALKLEDGWACLNTQRANDILSKLMAVRGELSLLSFLGAQSFLEEFGGGDFKAEAKFDNETRFDGLITDGHRSHWIEVKSVSLRTGPRRIAFPDAVTTRGTKHLHTLTRSIEDSPLTAATLIFAITRGSDREPEELAAEFDVAREIDPQYAKAALEAQKAGVRFRALVLGVTPTSLSVRAYLPLHIQSESATPWK